MTWMFPLLEEQCLENPYDGDGLNLNEEESIFCSKSMTALALPSKSIGSRVALQLAAVKREWLSLDVGDCGFGRLT